MSEELFDVVFFGILQAGKDKEAVMQNMAALFKTDASKLAPYFAGGRKVIKGKIKAQAAAKYQAALENVGLVIKIEPYTAPQVEASDSSAEATQDSATTDSISGMTLAPVGADIIENPVAASPPPVVATSNLTLAEAGVDVIENPVEIPAQKIENIDDITVADVGVDVLEHPEEVVAQKIEDISGISIAEPGADIIANPKAEIKADIPDTSELSLKDERS